MAKSKKLHSKNRRHRKKVKKEFRKVIKIPPSLPSPSKLKLENTWTLWFHQKNNREWNHESFTKIYTISTVQDFWRVYNNISNFDKELFFLMKGDIFPLWEEPENRNGGTWNISVPRKKGVEMWIDLCLLLVGETFCTNFNNGHHINGISIRPKFSNSLIKIWMGVNDMSIPIEKKYNIKEIAEILPENYNMKNIIFNKYCL